MSRHFASIAYTPSVRASQRLHGGRDLGEGLDETGETPVVELGPREYEFIAARDSFYLSTVSESGWPHVQHRGGQAGFLQVLDPTTLAFVDLSGNRQYVSVGNLSGNDRAALILMDYPNRRRLKILGHVEMVELATVNPKLLAKMKIPESDVERIMLIRIAAFDWNCSRHITPRFTESEWQTRSSSLPTTSITKE
ncbi:MAG: pyridoxamine 5'-phosphate oxidase family protein [Gammaproteobacteria bacterium]|nr:pyridoxamine 5'-phosphate oxidase family protein [Gammaproteobacteria bacterium]MBU2435978.1 pyridoxamine 5'-phosphate oxidase family protein [Gammaproteobacteria bacterium]MBU2449240.1 pyridoxamine 5'-phosphate oxidase family protein [Gammaproteobacteria bacterium]